MRFPIKENSIMRAASIGSPPHSMCAMWRVPFPTCGYPVMWRNSRMPSTADTAQTRNTSA
ncbi:MAG: hypothetical protein R3B51_01745 [Thermodesulfobacteriota bacterium]